ncbi:MAG: ribonuclease III [Oligosphaeraceae bacterium]
MRNFNLKAEEWEEAARGLQERTGYAFREPALLRLALTHSSYAAESSAPRCPWNERLEFLGDAVLQLVISRRLFQEFPHAQEGELTRARSVLVDEPANARNACALGLQALLLLGKGEAASGGRQRPSILGDLFEAYLGALCLDGGMEEVERLLLQLLPSLKDAVEEAERSDNPKGELQQFCQGRFHAAPQYQDLAARGPSHAPRFLCQVTLPEGETRCFTGEGASKKQAEREAAKAALTWLAAHPLPPAP